MSTFQFELVTPERLVFSRPVDGVVIPGTEGDFEVLAQHAPVMSTIRPGLIGIREAPGNNHPSPSILQGQYQNPPWKLNHVILPILDFHPRKGRMTFCIEATEGGGENEK